MAIQAVQQERAAYALQQVQNYAEQFAAQPLGERKSNRKKFKARASELPFMVHANGLGQALAFFKSKGRKDGYNCLYAILEGWLLDTDRPFEEYENALDAVTQCDRVTYVAAQAEAILLMTWVKQFASAFMDGEGT